MRDSSTVDALWLLLREAASGIAAVHALDMVHRDIKPSNVMLSLDGLTLIDFGVARAAEQSLLTRPGMVVGTPAYMSPEQASGRASRPAPSTSSRSARSSRTRRAAGRPTGRSPGTGSCTGSCTRNPTSTPYARWTRDSPSRRGLPGQGLRRPAHRRRTGRTRRPARSVHPAGGRHRGADRAGRVRGGDTGRSGRTGVAGEAHGARDAQEPEKPEASGAAREKRGRHARVIPVVIPVIVATGATVAFQLLPLPDPVRVAAQRDLPARRAVRSGVPVRTAPGSSTSTGQCPDHARPSGTLMTRTGDGSAGQRWIRS
ncbi:protein kinase [Streptomyces griseoloalbus]|uniref:protein kinase domain-containing protein n=1 Tax=Streptomyces griseoloalbus TaxID=67303 RepID=UPI0033B37145